MDETTFTLGQPPPLSALHCACPALADRMSDWAGMKDQAQDQPAVSTTAHIRTSCKPD